MSLQPKPSLSFEEWLEGERAATDGWTEYAGGEVFAMSSGTAEHHTVIGNIVRELGVQLKGRPCRVYGQGMRLQIPSEDAGKYPDLMALCGEQQFRDGRRDLLLNPSLIVEVLSDATEGYDRGGKFALYRGLPSLAEYLLVDPRRVLVELYTRAGAGRWTLTVHDRLEAVVTLPSIGCELALAEVYDKVDVPGGGTGD